MTKKKTSDCSSKESPNKNRNVVKMRNKVQTAEGWRRTREKVREEQKKKAK